MSFDKREGRVRLYLNPRTKSSRAIIDAKRTLAKKDVSTNPEVQAKARQYGMDALRTLKRVLNSPLASDVAKISAAQALLDRGFGKPTQTNINAQVTTDGKPSEIADEELSRRTKEVITRIEALTRRKREKVKDEIKPPDVRQLH